MESNVKESGVTERRGISNVRELICGNWDCESTEQALYADRWREGVLICRWCWALQNGDLPEGRGVEPALRATDG
jgi:hypothetical protein